MSSWIPQRYVTAILIAMISIVSGCASSGQALQHNSQELFCSEQDTLTFMVHSSYSSEPLQNIEVILCGKDGLVTEVGETDYYGQIHIEKDRICASNAILFCGNGYFCGAFVVAASDIVEYDVRLIHLAPFAL